jgi:hypothetical protein
VTRITQARLRQLFHHNRKTGEIWKKPPVPQFKVGALAGRRHSSGKVVIHIYGKDYGRAHLIYQYVYGGPLPSEVLHINGKLADDPRKMRRFAPKRAWAVVPQSKKRGVRGVRGTMGSDLQI